MILEGEMHRSSGGVGVRLRRDLCDFVAFEGDGGNLSGGGRRLVRDLVDLAFVGDSESERDFFGLLLGLVLRPLMMVLNLTAGS